MKKSGYYSHSKRDANTYKTPRKNHIPWTDIYIPAKTTTSCQKEQSLETQSDQTHTIKMLTSTGISVLGLPQSLYDEKLLQSHDYFGQYGKIESLKINQPSQETQIIFSSSKEASIALIAVDNYMLRDYQLRGYFLLNQFCPSFLNKEICRLKTCLFLHEIPTKEHLFKSLQCHNNYDSQTIAMKIIENHISEFNSITNQMTALPNLYYVLQKYQKFSNKKLKILEDVKERMVFVDEYRELDTEIQKFLSTPSEESVDISEYPILYTKKPINNEDFSFLEGSFLYQIDPFEFYSSEQKTIGIPNFENQKEETNLQDDCSRYKIFDNDLKPDLEKYGDGFTNSNDFLLYQKPESQVPPEHVLNVKIVPKLALLNRCDELTSTYDSSEKHSINLTPRTITTKQLEELKESTIEDTHSQCLNTSRSEEFMVAPGRLKFENIDTEKSKSLMSESLNFNKFVHLINGTDDDNDNVPAEKEICESKKIDQVQPKAPVSNENNCITAENSNPAIFESKSTRRKKRAQAKKIKQKITSSQPQNETCELESDIHFEIENLNDSKMIENEILNVIAFQIENSFGNIQTEASPKNADNQESQGLKKKKKKKKKKRSKKGDNSDFPDAVSRKAQAEENVIRENKEKESIQNPIIQILGIQKSMPKTTISSIELRNNTIITIKEEEKNLMNQNFESEDSFIVTQHILEKSDNKYRLKRSLRLSVNTHEDRIILEGSK